MKPSTNVSAAFLVALVVTGAFIVVNRNVFDKPDPNSSYKVFDSAAVVCNTGQCSSVGKDILKKGGSVVDAGIATALCLGVTSLQSSGIGGGFFMNYYDANNEKSYFIDAREVAPLAGYPEMYNTSTSPLKFGKSYIAVPGEVAGYWEAHRRFGKLNWNELFYPAIRIAEKGFKMNARTSFELQRVVKFEQRNKRLRALLSNPDGSLKTTGDIVVLPKYAQTLRVIAKEGPNAFYNGSLTKSIVEDIHDGYGSSSLITAEDFIKYRVHIRRVLGFTLGDSTLLIPELPSGGPVLAFILNVLKGYNFTSQNLNTEKVLTYHRIVEAIKFGFSRRKHLGDSDFNPDINEFVEKMLSHEYGDEIRSKIDDLKTHDEEYYGDNSIQIPEDHGTAHLGILGPDGSALAMTSTINYPFGSGVVGERTGIIFNNEMADFTTPKDLEKGQKSNNLIKPGKRPLSSMAPTIVLKHGTEKPKVDMVIGAAGGAHIITSTLLTFIQNNWFNKNLDESVKSKRLHHTLTPNTLLVEEGMKQTLIDGLSKKGHSIKSEVTVSAVHAIQRLNNGKLAAKCDDRKGGYPDGF